MIRISAKSKRGFTLIELLVVIAIIAILAAILFPVFGHVREQVRQTTCMGNMHEIGVDVKLYREDTGKYPTILMCIPYILNPAPPPAPVQIPYDGSTGTPLNAGSVLNRPFKLANGQKYNQDVSIYQCPDNLANDRTKVFQGAVYPLGVPLIGMVLNPATGKPFYYYSFDSYDTGPQINTSGNIVPNVTEIHYALDWTGPNATGQPGDPQNQLKYPLPPEDKTVITWCNYHVATAHADQIMVLLLNGTAKSTQYSKFVYQSPAQPNGPLGFNP